jgi:hypothetical protein
MDKERILKIIHNLETVLDELKLEVNSENDLDYEETSIPIYDYDEIFADDEY